MLEEFAVGLGIDTNMAEMIEHFAQSDDSPVTGDSLWEKLGTSPETQLESFLQKNHITDGDERLALPTFGSYKMIYTD